MRIILLVSLLALSACAQFEQKNNYAELSAISDEASGIYHPGKIIWHDLITPDAQASQQFYAALFGWSFVQGKGQYIEIYQGPDKIGGMMEIPPKDEQPVMAEWLISISVPDVDQAAAWVKEQGGQIINGPLDMPQRGRGALVSDPKQGRLVLLKAKGGDPEDRIPAIGAWLWNEYWTDDLQTSLNFYRQLGQYEAVEQGEDYAILINEGHWRAGIRQIDQVEYSGRWVPVVRVADPQALLDQVEALGGVVWVRPDEVKNSQNVALISDSTGALLMLQSWNFAGEE